MIGAKLANLPVGNPRFTSCSNNAPAMSQKEISEFLGVSTVMIYQASTILAKYPATAAAIEAGNVTVSKAFYDIKNQKTTAADTLPTVRNRVGKLTASVAKCFADVLCPNIAEERIYKEASSSAFAKTVIGKTYTGEAFREKVGELAKLVEKCTIAVPILIHAVNCQ
jgi:hypothetical protein